jgi:hypothetical protein
MSRDEILRDNEDLFNALTRAEDPDSWGVTQEQVLRNLTTELRGLVVIEFSELEEEEQEDCRDITMYSFDVRTNLGDFHFFSYHTLGKTPEGFHSDDPENGVFAGAIEARKPLNPAQNRREVESIKAEIRLRVPNLYI